MPAPNLHSEDYYAILGCDRNTDDATLKKAYRKLAVKWHPDKNPDNETATKHFQKISEAYATLSDPKKRQLYNQYGKEGVNAADQMPDGAAGMGGMGGMGGMPGMHFSGMPGGGGHGMTPEQAQMFFADIFGGGDPFGSSMGGGGMHGGIHGGMPGMSYSMGGGGMNGGIDPISMMFGGGGGMPGGMSGMHGGMGGMPGMSSARRSATRPAQQQQPKRYDTIPPGTVVSLQGLVNKSDMNGDHGVVQQFNPRNERYIVLLADTEETMSVKASNLLQHAKVSLHDITSQPELNGKKGTILAWSSSKERYNILVSNPSKVVSLRPANVKLDNGTVAQIQGLKSKPELNGKFGTIKEWIPNSNKYDVQLSASQVIRVKVEVMRV